MTGTENPTTSPTLAMKEKDATQSISTRLADANERKTDGNNAFRDSKWSEAIVLYEAALNLLPKRRSLARPTRSSSRVAESTEPESSTKVPDIPQFDDEDDQEDVAVQDGSEQEEALAENEKAEVLQLRSVLWANIGACHVKLGDHKQAVEACTRGEPSRASIIDDANTRPALKDNPTYEKALRRRIDSNEALNSWTSLTAAQEDYTTLLSIVESNTQKRDIETKLRRLKPRIEAAQKKETSEMLDKLKALGNSFLGNFGLSTDNFKFEPNGQGGYSMNIVR